MIQTNVPLKNFSNYKIGGPADYFIEVKTKDDLLKGVKEWQTLQQQLPKTQEKVFILGGGTNILFPDDGLRGLVIKVSLDSINLDTEIISVGAGTLITTLTNFCIENSLSGFDWAGGMPGTVGGAIRGNAGAFGGETKDNVSSVTSLNLDTLQIVERNSKRCEFSYRSSIFKTKATNEVIISADFFVKKGDKKQIEDKIYKEQEFRKTKHPLESPNAGSVFKNVPVEKFSKQEIKKLSQYIKNDPFPVIPAAKLIFLANLTGQKLGQVQISEKHTNFIINLGNAKAREVKDLMEIIKSKVKHKFGVELEPEIMIL